MTLARSTAFLALFFCCVQSVFLQPSLQWPEMNRETKPWTRWWWMGNAVNATDLTACMEAYKKIGLGGLEITPIYGVIGEEDKFIDYLSPQWMELLQHTLNEAKRLDLGIDLATGTGWPFGGPWVGMEDACKNLEFKTWNLKGGERLSEPVTFTQEPMVRSVINQVYQGYNALQQADGTMAYSWEHPQPKSEIKQLKINDLVEDIGKNKNLQALALDQVKFEKQLPLVSLMAYSDAGEQVDLTKNLTASGKLNWKAPRGNWTLYAVFQGWHGKMVERAAPGGEGNVIDHFSKTALQRYLNRFDKAFASYDVSTIRAYFNDSYEVDDARGQADWTPDLWQEFQTRRGYNLRHHLPALFGNDTPENNERVLTDYRETISDLLLDYFTTEWKKWSHDKGALMRNQSHGSPANILDLYAASDIPETEGTDILRIKLASSATHISGKKLTSAEAATWLNDHFESTLADVKENVDRYFLGGVNHICYHGTNYSPADAEWPGWLFYAAVHFHPNNPFWDDFAALNSYVTHVQSFLQSGTPDNDVLLYFPIYDRYANRGAELLEHFGGRSAAYDSSAFKANALLLQERGYAFDFISDRQLGPVKSSGGNLQIQELNYQVVVVPKMKYMPLETLEKLITLAEQGATIIFHNALPADVAGLANLAARKQAFQELIKQLNFKTAATTFGIQEAAVGNGKVLLGNDLEQLLTYANVERETMTELGLQYIRRRNAQGDFYFLVNWSDQAFDSWLPLQTDATAAAIFDPMQQKTGLAKTVTSTKSGTKVYLQLAKGASIILQTYTTTPPQADLFEYYKIAGAALPLPSNWKIEFIKGGPVLPESLQLDSLQSWTTIEGEAAKNFSGTARYTLHFSIPEQNFDAYLLQLGAVHNSASIRLNGQKLATLIGPTFQVLIPKTAFQSENTLEIDVSNSMGNRIANLERRNVFWKKFYNVNFPANSSKNRGADGLFTAKDWQPMASGLLKPVRLIPVEWNRK